MSGSQGRIGLGLEMEREQEFDNNGWAHIHHAAFNGYQKSVLRFVRTKPERLEMLTQDEQQLTPLLAACISGKQESIETLIELGASLRATDRKLLGVVELSSLNGNNHLLEYFLTFDTEVDVYRKLYNCLKGNTHPELETSACSSLNILSTNQEHCKEIVETEGIREMLLFLGSPFANDAAKHTILNTLLNILDVVPMQGEILQCNGLNILTNLIATKNISVNHKAVKLVGILAVYGGVEVKHMFESLNGLMFIVDVIKSGRDNENLILECLNTLVILVSGDVKMQNSFDTQANGLDALIDVLRCFNDSLVLNSVVKTIIAVISDNKGTQTVFAQHNGIPVLLNLLKSKYADCVINTVIAIKRLAQQNEQNQEELLKYGTVNMLIKILRRSSKIESKSATASALWAIAGEKFAQRRAIATFIGVSTCVEFLGSSVPSQLHFCGSEALETLTRGVGREIDEIAASGGVHRILHILGNATTPVYVTLSLLKTLRALCIAPGYFPHTSNQKTAANEGAIRILVNLATHAKTEIEQAESFYSLGSVVFGNKENVATVIKTTDFDYIDVLGLLYSDDYYIRQISGSTLALFGFNNRRQLQLMAYSGGIPYQHFVPFFMSADKECVAHTAFQIIVLSRIIPDETAAMSSASGIKILVDLLSSANEEIQALSANLLCGLANLKSGIPEAIISIGTIAVLCKLLNSQFDIVQASATGALCQLSCQPEGQRQLVNECRHDPYLFTVMQKFSHRLKLPAQFLERWKHHKHIGLPPIRHNNPQLSSTNYLLVPEQTSLSGSPSVIMEDDNEEVSDGSIILQNNATPFKLPLV